MILNSKSIGNKIASARKNNNLSQAGLAQLVSISPQAVGKWERGESMPDLPTVNRLAKILGVDLNYFSENFHDEDMAVTSFEKPEQTEGKTHSLKSEKKSDLNWDMSQGNWSDADFSKLKNLQEKFSSSNIKNCKFLNADLSGLTLEKNNIELCDFSGANIRSSKILSSNILNNLFNTCSFIDAELVKSNIEKCNFTDADFSGAEFQNVNLESNTVNNVAWKLTKFKKTNFSNMTFSGTIENCHFEHCGFYKVKFENATLLNTFFKYNERFKKVQFVNCMADSITLAFLKNNQANLTGITLIS